MSEQGSASILKTEKPRKFGKQIQRQQLDLPEYAASFLNYKALKKVCTDPDRYGTAKTHTFRS
jgi:hypothetical protein